MGHYEFLSASHRLATRTESRTRTRALTRAALDPYGDQNLKLPFHNNRFQRRHISSLKKFPFHTRFKISGTVTTLPGPAPRPQSTIIPTLPTMKHHGRRKSSSPLRQATPMPLIVSLLVRLLARMLLVNLVDVYFCRKLQQSAFANRTR